MRFALILATLSFTLVFAGCGENKKAEDGMNEMEYSVESGITSIGGVADEQSNGSFASNRMTFETYAYKAKNLLMPEAWAASCSRAALAACSAGVRSETYSSCQLPYSSRTMTGQVTLSYSDASCSLSSTGNQVERSYNLAINGLYGGALNISSASHTDYRGNTFGGGGRLTKTAGGWTVEVLGKNKRFSRAGRELFNISTRTLTPISVTGSLSRSSRVVNGGSFEVIHNKAQFVATYVPSNLAWSSACCHPISGSLAVTYAGSVTGSSSVTFNGCGLATMVKDGLSSQITLNYCE